MTPRSLLFGFAILFLLSFLPADKKKYIDPANMDLSVRPGDNFYLYANGTWIKNNPVPASKTRWGSFDELREANLKRLQGLLESAAAGAATDPKLQKIGDFYTSGMDSAGLERLGYQPIQADLARIVAIDGIPALLKEIAYERSHGIASPLVGLNIAPDRKNVSQYIPQVGQGVISLPDRDPSVHLIPAPAPAASARGSRCCWPADSPGTNRRYICCPVTASTNAGSFYSGEKWSRPPRMPSGIR